MRGSITTERSKYNTEYNARISLFSWVSRSVSRLRTALKRAPRFIGPEIKLEAVLAAMADAVVIADRSGNFVDFNESFAHLHRFKTKAECAQALHEYWDTFEVFTLDGSPLSADEWPMAKALRGESASHVELNVRRRDIEQSWIGSYTYAPIRMDDGSIVGAVLTGRDVTEILQAEESLKNVSSRLHLALTSARLGVWEWDIPKNKLSWDDRMFELYGLSRDTFPTVVGGWEATVHPDDRKQAVGLFNAAVHGKGAFDTEFRVIHPCGTVKYLKANGLVLRDANGKP